MHVHRFPYHQLRSHYGCRCNTHLRWPEQLPYACRPYASWDLPLSAYALAYHARRVIKGCNSDSRFGSQPNAVRAGAAMAEGGPGT